MLQTEDDLCCVESHLMFGENSVLTEVVVKVAAVHQVEYEAQLVRRLEGVGHADDEGTVLSGGHQTEHHTFVQRQRLSLFHFDALFIETLHCVHFPCVGLPTAVHLAKASSANDSVHAKVVHSELYVQLEVLPLAKTGIFITRFCSVK